MMRRRSGAAGWINHFATQRVLILNDLRWKRYLRLIFPLEFYACCRILRKPHPFCVLRHAQVPIIFIIGNDKGTSNRSMSAIGD